MKTTTTSKLSHALQPHRQLKTPACKFSALGITARFNAESIQSA